MSLYNGDLMYEFQAKDLGQTESIRQYTDHMVKEIKVVSGWDADVHVHLEPVAKDKRLFSVSMSVYGLGEPIVVRKEGKNVMTVLRKVRRAIMRQVYRVKKKEVSFRRRNILREQFAS